jgi:hypothetical protein
MNANSGAMLYFSHPSCTHCNAVNPVAISTLGPMCGTSPHQLIFAHYAPVLRAKHE